MLGIPLADGRAVTQRPVPIPTGRVCLCACALAIAGAPQAFAQRGLPPTYASKQPIPTQLDEGVADLDPNTISLRKMDIDLRQDTDFDHIYSPPGRPDLLMRRSGAVTAVFQHSFYNAGEGGMVCLIPPGTVFFIGEPCESPGLPSPLGKAAASAAVARSPHAGGISAPVSAPIDARVSSATYSPTPHSPAPDDTSYLVSIAWEKARAQRLREIAQRLGPR